MFTNSVIIGNTDLRSSWGENPEIRITATGPYSQTVANTREDGSYQFTGLGDGTYSLSFSKDGFGTVKLYNIQLLGNDTAHVRSVSLFSKVDFHMPLFTKVSVMPDPNESQFVSVFLETKGYIDRLSDPVPIIVFLDNKKSVSYKSSIVRANYFLRQTEEGGKIVFSFTQLLPFKKGTVVYLQAYVANPDEIMYGYFDNYLGFGQYSTLIPESHSPVMSFIMP